MEAHRHDESGAPDADEWAKVKDKKELLKRSFTQEAATTQSDKEPCT